MKGKTDVVDDGNDNDGDEGNDVNDHDAVVRENIDEKPPPTFIWFDFETVQQKQIGENEYGPILQHEPNLCIVHKQCENCLTHPLGHCILCGQNRLIFEGPHCTSQFCEWLFGPHNNGATAIAHNAKGFDGQFILRYLQQQGIQPSIVPKGLELMSLSAGKVRIIDSLNFLPMPLAALPKAFGEPELCKGYFPHLFNRVENQNYVGPWPDAYYYSPATMKEPVKQDFYKWYNQQTSKV